MTWWIWTLIGIYGVGFFGTFYMLIVTGPVTLGLAFVCAVVWPILWATGWPLSAGESQSPD